MKRGCCFDCGRQFVMGKDGPIYVERNYHGATVKFHKDCAKRHDEEKEPSAKAPVIGSRGDV